MPVILSILASVSWRGTVGAVLLIIGIGLAVAYLKLPQVLRYLLIGMAVVIALTWLYYALISVDPTLP